MDDDSIEINLRPVAEVAARMIVLAAVIRRAVLELPLDEEDDEDESDSPDGQRFDLMTALTNGPLAAATTPREIAFVTAPIGAPGHEVALAASWEVEALAALAWATSPGAQLPEPWNQTDPGPLLSVIPEPSDDATGFVAALELAAEEEIAWERERAELWAWRSAIDDDLRVAKGSERAELLDILRETVVEAVESELLPGGDEDFPVRNRPFSGADPETKALIAEIAARRLQALNWLCGHGAAWDDVPLDL
jgi:Domain of unknown function (DUF4272)